MSDNRSHETTAQLPDPWQALSDLVAACGGEVEDVFGGEIGDALRVARATLSRQKPIEDALVALSTEIGKLDADFPNHGDWPIDLPAGYWREIAVTLKPLASMRFDAADVGRALKTLAIEHPQRYRDAVGDPSQRLWFVERIVEICEGELSFSFVSDMVSTVFVLLPSPNGAANLS